MRNHERNDSLRNLAKETGWTHHSFAVAVNRTGAEAGVTLHYDRTAVSHWLTGSRPRPPVPEFVAEALSRRLGRAISPADAGFPDTAKNVVDLPTEQACGMKTLIDLVAADLSPMRRANLRELPFRAAWTVVPSWAGGTPPRSSVVNEGEAAALVVIGTMTSAFAAADRMLGGGHARSAGATYLASAVLDHPNSGPSGNDNHAHLGAAATLAQLIGFMCFDNLNHNLAQRYYRAALQLAREANEVNRHAEILCNMSVQALFLGHYQAAARLADTAVRQGSVSAPPSTRTALLGQAAVCRAALSDGKEALNYLTAAEKAFEHADDGQRSGAATGQADLEHRTGMVLASLRNLRQAEAALSASLRNRPEAERRSRMLTTYHLADVQLRRARPEQACATWQRFLGEYSYMRSERINMSFRRFRSSLQQHRNNEVVRHVLHQASKLAG